MSYAIVVPKAWRSELNLLISYVVLSIAAVVLSRELPGSVLRGHILTVRNYDIFMDLPLFCLVSASVLCIALFRLYNVRYLMDESGVECRLGVLWTSQTMFRVRSEDIVGLETKQTLFERFLDIGDVLIGTAATGGIEITLSGVGAPFEVIKMIQNERNLRSAVRN